MTIERILKAAVASMITGHHSPHCFSAHVIGQGYVNKGDNTHGHSRADYLRQLERTATSEVENLGYAPAYAKHQGETQPRRGVLMANWNYLPTGLDFILERAGYAVEWSDEWSTCESCNGAVRTEPDGYFWEPPYKLVDDCTILCLDCYADEHVGEDDEETTDDQEGG